MQDDLEYCDHLFDSTTDGYIQIMQLKDGSSIRIYNTKNKNLRCIVEKFENKLDVYTSINTYYKPVRAVNNIRQFRALYIDLDLKKYSKSETVYEVYDLVNDGKIPEPTMIVDSGRGLHLYWRIKNAPSGALKTWQGLEDYLYNKLKKLGADIKATDGARVLRLPFTINSRNNAECKIISIKDDLEYSMYDLREKYLHYKPKPYQLEFEQTKELRDGKRKDKCIRNKFFNSYSLHMARVDDIKTICMLREYDVKGYRNFIIHCFAYWDGIYVRDPEELEKEVFDLNNSFKQPLKEREIEAVLRCIPKAINKFIDYQQGLLEGQAKRVSKGMKDKGGYWYKNQTLIERLDITPEEQKYLKTIIGTEEKYRRNNNKRNPRNAAGLTNRQQQKAEKVQAVKELCIKGFLNKEIAEKLNISIRQVQRYKKFF